jgi:Putative methyltransferase
MSQVSENHWLSWHQAYDDPGSALSHRLAAVQQQIRAALDAAPAGPLRAISMCAGQGRDLIGVLASHPRRGDVTARLVELDPRLAAAARTSAQAAGLPQVEVVTGDAALTDNYAGMVPADLVLVCGVFGNITDKDIERTVDHCTQLCAQAGTVIWTRGRWPPDLVPQICEWFSARGFEPVWISDPATGWAVVAHRLAVPPAPLEPAARMFTFIAGHPSKGPHQDSSLPRHPGTAPIRYRSLKNHLSRTGRGTPPAPPPSCPAVPR